jgi:hypothetical protein
MEHDPEYPVAGAYRLSEHTLDRVVAAITHHAVGLPDIPESMLPLPPGVDDALGLFAGYLLLDALIGNTDRHHENWAVVV